MSFLYFGGTMSLVDAATPSTGAWTVAYDSDGVLKQKDEFGVITVIGSGGIGSTPSLSDVLSYGNNAGGYSIEMTDGSSIYSESGALSLDSGNTTLENTSLTGNSSLTLRPNNLSSFLLPIIGAYSDAFVFNCLTFETLNLLLGASLIQLSTLSMAATFFIMRSSFGTSSKYFLK